MFLWQLRPRFSGRCRCREVADVERFKQEWIYGHGLSVGTKKVTVVERWPLVEVQLYMHEDCPILNTSMHGLSIFNSYFKNNHPLSIKYTKHLVTDFPMHYSWMRVPQSAPESNNSKRFDLVFPISKRYFLAWFCCFHCQSANKTWKTFVISQARVFRWKTITVN